MSSSPRPATRKFRTPEAARHLGLSPQKLKALRATADGPAFIRIGRAVLYDLNDLEAFAAAHRHPAPPRPALGARPHLA